MKTRVCLFALLMGLVVAGGVGSGLVVAGGAPSIDRWVIAGGGGSAAAGGISLYSTTGQAVVGRDQSDGMLLWHGFLVGRGDLGRPYSLYLPVVLKGTSR